jgi:hypothetical protein
MRLIVKSLLFCAALAACAPPSVQAPEPAPLAPAEAMPPPLLMAADFSVSCNAQTLARCDAEGCVHEGGAAPSVPLAWSFDGNTGQGSLCIATGCAATDVIAPPGAPAEAGEDLTGLLVTAPLVFDEANGEQTAGPPTLFDGIVSMSRDGVRFLLTQQSAGGMTVWTGSCAR